MNWTEQDVDNLLASVEEVLAKSESLKKDEDGKDKPADDKSAPDAAAAPAPAADAAAAPADASAAPAPADDAAGDAAAAPADAQAADAAAAPAADGDQALQQDQDAPLSDEELSQIYGSMAPEELERHYSIIRQQLQAQMGQADAGAAPTAEPAAPAPAAAAPSDDMNKSEKDAEIETLRKQVGEQAQAIEQITKAFEVLTKPARKSITEIQVMHKSESDNGEAAPMTSEQVKEAARKLSPAKLEKAERELVNKFFLEGEGQKEVEKLIHSKGGK